MGLGILLNAPAAVSPYDAFHICLRGSCSLIQFFLSGYTFAMVPGGWYLLRHAQERGSRSCHLSGTLRA